MLRKNPLLVAALMTLATANVACISIRGDIQPGNPPSAAERQEKGLGFVGVSLDFKFASVKAVPRLELEVENMRTGKRTKLLAERTKGAEEGVIPVTFALEEGRYLMRRAYLRVPGGDYNGDRFDANEVDLGLSQAHIFELGAGEFLHLGHQSLDATLYHKNGRLTVSYNQEYRPALPSRKAWAATIASLAPEKRSYLRKANASPRSNKVTWEHDAGLESGKGAGAPGPTSASQKVSPNRDDELNKLIVKIGFEVRKCSRAHVPGFKGDVKFEVLVSPEGRFEGVAFESDAWTKSAQGKDCVQGYLSTLRLPEREDGRTDSWILTFEG